ncbi:MAG TPA: DUF3368 domain-containing protein [Bacteroidales bacterium]|nr:DUF3368 domain-containing protein [Bacteroidales bacterium]
MRKVVSNTTPLISLLKLSKLELLKELYKEISIPFAVFQEIEAGRNKAFYQDLSTITWIKIREIKDKKALKYFLELDTGEAEAIVLANEIGADLIILDEKLGRFHAKHADLQVTGTIGILLKAKSTGLISAIKPLLQELIDKDVWISGTLMNEILQKANEK